MTSSRQILGRVDFGLNKKIITPRYPPTVVLHHGRGYRGRLKFLVQAGFPIWYIFRNRGGGVEWVPPPSKNLDMAQISEKSWELPNFWVPDQNPASPRHGWT